MMSFTLSNISLEERLHTAIKSTLTAAIRKMAAVPFSWSMPTDDKHQGLCKVKSVQPFGYERAPSQDPLEPESP